MRGLLFGATIAATLSIVTTTALAADDPIDVRQKIMTSVGKSGGLLFGMVKGKTEFDERAAGGSFGFASSGGCNDRRLFP